MEAYETVDGIGRSAPPQNLRGFVPLVILSQVVGLTAVIVVAIWMGSFSGGFAWTAEKVFNYHPLFMVLGLIFLFADSMLAYRIFRNSSKLSIKLLHAALHILALVFAAIGLRAVFYAHNINNKANLYSMHSWVGLSCVVLFGLQWLLGFVSFLFPKLPESMRASLMPIHRAMGVGIFLLAVAAALMGIQENNDHQTDPSYEQMGAKTMMGNLLGILLVVFCAIVTYIVTRDHYRRIDPIDEERIVLND